MNHFQLLLDQSIQTLTTIVSSFWYKTPVCFILAGIAFFFGVENQSMLSGLVLLLVFDLVTGLMAAYLTKTPIESRRLLKSASKLAVYGILCSSAFLVESILRGTTLIDEGMIAFLAVTELISIMENAGKMGFSVPQKLLNQLVTIRSSK